MRVGLEYDVCGKFIKNFRNSQKIEWRVHFDLPLDTGQIQKFDQKEVRKLLQKDATEEITVRSGNC